MLGFSLDNKDGAKSKVLCLGAHSDDIEIGCGGSVLKMIANDEIEAIYWVVFASNDIRKKEALDSAEAFLKDVENKTIQVFSYRDAFLNFSAYEIKEKFEAIKKAFDPDVVFTHYRDDRHQDHRLISDLTWNTFRNHLILEYEIPKYDGDLGIPNCFFQIPENLTQRKVAYLLTYFNTQKKKHWFDKETFLSLMRIRGLESAAESKYAEAFHIRKMVL